MRLEGKVALITGAARGLGHAMARRFHDEGARVIVNDLSLDAARDAAATVQGLGLAADVSDEAAVRAMYDEVREWAGRVDILVNNAGIAGHEGLTPEEHEERIREMQESVAAGMRGEVVHSDATLNMEVEAWDHMQAVHMRGTFLCTRGALEFMTAQESGSIINLGSIMGTYGKPGGTAYSAAKAGILGFTRALAHEVASRHIRVNAIAPGWIETDMTDPMGPMKPLLEAGIPLGAFGQPDDIAWAAVYLASDEARYVTGQVLSPNGGWYMSQ